MASWLVPSQGGKKINNNHPNANSFLHGPGFPMRHDWLCSLLYWSFFYILVSSDLFSLFLRTADFGNDKNGNHTVESIRQRETNFNQAQLRHRDVSSIASNFSLFWTKFWQVRKCLCQIKLKSKLFWKVLFRRFFATSPRIAFVSMRMRPYTSLIKNRDGVVGFIPCDK